MSVGSTKVPAWTALHEPGELGLRVLAGALHRDVANLARAGDALDIKFERQDSLAAVGDAASHCSLSCPLYMSISGWIAFRPALDSLGIRMADLWDRRSSISSTTRALDGQ